MNCYYFKPILIVIAVLFCASANADCSVSGIRVFPTAQTIKPNSIFIIEGYSRSQAVIRDLNKKHNIYLKSGDKKIRLLVTELYRGQFHLTQAILKPETTPEAGLEYRLMIDSLPEYETFRKNNSSSNKQEDVVYKVTGEKDLDKPMLSGKPEELKKLLIHYGCGPAINVVFSNPATDLSEVYIKTTVKSLQSGIENCYYLIPDGAKVKVGHEMCAGAFDFADGNDYEVDFSYVDASGNLTNMESERIKFVKPLKAKNGIVR